MAGRKPYTWSRKPTAARRTYRAAADNMKARAAARARQATAKLRGHKEFCRTCGKTFRTPRQLAAHTREHARERAQAQGSARTKNTGRAKVPTRGDQFTDLSTGKKFRNQMEFNDHARQQAERQERAEKRQQERTRRTQAANGRATRNGQPKGTPKTRTDRTRGKTSAERKAEWHAHRMQHAAGRVTRDGARVPHEPSPRVVRPRVRVEPKVH